MTLEIHVISDHYEYYFSKSEETLRHSNGEFTESCHSSLRKYEENRDPLSGPTENYDTPHPHTPVNTTD